ncbi:MAG: MFS transporter [Candidatus Altiarchaeota archaeon]
MKFPHFQSQRKFRNYAAIDLMVFLWSIGNGAVWFMLPEITEGISGSLLIAGFLVSFPSFVSLIFDIPIGNLLSKISGKKMITYGLLMLGVVAFMLPYIKTIAFMLVFLSLVGFLYDVVYTPAVAYVIASTKKEVVSEYMGATMSVMHLGYAIGPVLVGLALSYVETTASSAAGLFLAFMCFASIVPTVLMLKDVRSRPDMMHVRKNLRLGRRLLKEVFDYNHLKSVGFTLLFATFLLTFYDGMVWMLEPVYGFKLNFHPLYVGLLLSAFTLPLILFQAPAGILADKYGRKKLMMVGLLTAGLFTVFFGVESSPAFMILHAFMATLGLSLAWPAVEGLVAGLNKGESTGVIVGVWTSAKDLGYVAGPALGALIAYSLDSIGSAFVVIGFVLIASSIVVSISKDMQDG